MKIKKIIDRRSETLAQDLFQTSCRRKYRDRRFEQNEKKMNALCQLSHRKKLWSRGIKSPLQAFMRIPCGVPPLPEGEGTSDLAPLLDDG